MNKKLMSGSILLLGLLLSVNVMATEASDKKSNEILGESYKLTPANDDALWQELEREIAAEKENQSNLLENHDHLIDQYEDEDCVEGLGDYCKAFYFDHTRSPYCPYETDRNKIPEPLKTGELEKQLQSVQYQGIRKNTSWGLYEGDDGMLY